MTRRIGSPDTQADIDVRACLDSVPPRSFVMVAGAGSGKTTSLVKALSHLAETKGPSLRRGGQQIACITYTEVAVGEITADVGASTLFRISTIHSFLWSIIRSFHSDIAAWVKKRIREKIAEKQDHYDRPRTQTRTKVRLGQEIANLEAELELIDRLPEFNYGTSSRYADGILGHDDILKLTPACVKAYPLLRCLIASRFPYIFVDESQDTTSAVIEALRHIADEQSRLCIGFFGDPMQKIYTTGAGAVPLSEGWVEITKPENFRCPTSVLGVINAIRAPGDGLRQVRGLTITVDGVEKSVVGTANIFVLPADNNRTARLTSVRNWLATNTGDDLWLSDQPEGDVRLLVLVHRMAAKRLGFPELYAALHDKAPLSFQEGLEDGTAWPLRTVIQQIMPIVRAARRDDHFTVMSILRTNCPRLERARLGGQPVPPVLAALDKAVIELTALLAVDSPATVRDVMLHVRETDLFRLDERFEPYFAAEPINVEQSGFANVQKFLACRVDELWNYLRYIEEESPFATQQGVKGAQFDRVLVVLDDEEGYHSHFSYGKYFGYVPLSEQDNENIAAGNDSVLDRTQRLFYVCCSRAVKDLAVVLFFPDVEIARAAVIGRNLFPEASVRGDEVWM